MKSKHFHGRHHIRARKSVVIGRQKRQVHKFDVTMRRLNKGISYFSMTIANWRKSFSEFMDKFLSGVIKSTTQNSDGTYTHAWDFSQKQANMNTQLDLIRMGARAKFGDIFASQAHVEIEKALDETYDCFITGRIYGEAHFKEYHFQYPANWREAVKERFFPQWALQRFPVKYIHQSISIDVLYPELSKRIKLPQEPHYMILNPSWGVEE